MKDTYYSIIAAIMSFFLKGLIIWWAWNASVPNIFNTPHITYWTAAFLGLLVKNLLPGQPIKWKPDNKEITE